MFKKTTQQGFTLIELLVVIAIIGILAATVLASLGTARQSGSDASLQSSINSMKAQAEIVFNQDTNYDLVCSGTGATSTAALRTAITANSSGTIACNDSNNAWAISGGLKAGGYFCADSTGFSGKRVTALGAGTVCPAT